MVSTVYWEWELLLKSIRLGLCLGVLYDGFKVSRLILKPWNWLKYLEDIVYWILSTAWIFQLQLEESNGVTRGFSMGTILITMAIYHTWVEKLWLSPVEKGILIGKRRLTDGRKKFKIRIEKQKEAWGCQRRKHDKKKNTNSKKETESSGNATGYYGGSCHDAGGGCQ